MTQNQLKYWELRWKQHYENAKLEIDRATLAHEIAKLNETIRHNRVSERQEKQRLIQEQQKIQQNWAKISFDYQAKIVELGINANRARAEWETRMRSLDLEERKLAQEEVKLAQEAEKILDNKLVIVSDIINTLKENKDKDERERMRILADAVGPLGKSMGLGVVGVLTAKVESMLSNSDYSNYLSYLQENYPETFRLTQESSQTSSTQTVKGNIRYKDYQETYGPQAPDKLEKDIHKYLTTKDDKSTNNTAQQTKTGTSGVSNYVPGTIVESGNDGHTSIGSTQSSVSYTTPSGVGVIYSPGSHFGPGY